MTKAVYDTNADGIIDVTAGGTGAATLTGVLKGNGTSAVTGSATTTDLAEGTNLYYTDARVRLNRLDQLAIPTASVSMNSQKITSLLDPTLAQDASTKNYVDTTKQGKFVVTVGSSNADYITTGTADNTQIQAAINAVNTAGGGMVLVKAGTYNFTNILDVKSNVTLRGESMYTTIFTASGTVIGTSSRGLVETGFNATSSNVRVERIKIVVNTTNAALRIASSSNVVIDNCFFTGTTAGTALVWIAPASITGASNIRILNSRLTDATATSGIYVTPTSGGNITDVVIDKNYFNNLYTIGVHIDDGTGLSKGIKVLNNQFIDLIGAQTGPGSTGCAVFAGLNTTYKVEDLLIQGNTYRNSRTGNEGMGFAWVYNAKNIKILNNTAIGPATWQANQIFFAPGRTTNPLIGVQVLGNYVEGFTAWMDFDATTYCEIANNYVYNCFGSGNPTIGYNAQKFIDIHDNIFYNCISNVSGLQSFFAIGNSTPVQCKIHDNIFIDDNNPPTNTPYAIVNTGSTYDSSDVEFVNNKFYLPNGDLTAFANQQGASPLPRKMEGNVVVQKSGVINFRSIQGNPTLGTNVDMDRIISGVNYVAEIMATPAAPTVTVTGTVGTTTYAYEIVAVNAQGVDSIPSSATTVTTGNATLTTANYNALAWSAIKGAAKYKILRSVSGAAYQLLATTTGTSINDQGQYTATAYTSATSSPGGNAQFTGGALALGDMSISAPTLKKLASYHLYVGDSISVAGTEMRFGASVGGVAPWFGGWQAIYSPSTNNIQVAPGGATTTKNSTIDDGSGNQLLLGYLRVGSVTAPTNTTAGDLTFVRGFGTSMTLTGALSASNFSGTNTGDQTILGTTNQVNVSTVGATTTLSLPQSIATTSTPTFGGLTLSPGTGNILVADTSTLIVDATNHRVGIGYTAPDAKLTVLTNAGANMKAVNISHNDTTNNPTAVIINNSTSGLSLDIENTGNSPGMQIINNTGTTGGGNNVLGYYVQTNSATTGAGFNMFWNSPGFTGIAGYGITNVRQVNASASGNALVLEQAGSGDALYVMKGKVHLAGAQSQASWTTNGIQLALDAATYTDTGTAGTRTSAVAASIAQPTFASTNAVTITDASTMYIAGAPLAGTNTTLTRAWGLWNVGVARFDANNNFGNGANSALSYLDIGGGYTTGGTSGVNQLSFNYVSGGGYRHFVVTRHNGGATGNSIDFYLNTSATSTASTSPGANNAIAFTINNNGIAVLPTANTNPTARLQLPAGTATANTAPLKLTAGVNLTTPEAGAMEYDGVQLYETLDTTSGQGAIPTEQYFHLTAAGGAITTIANYFGTTSNISLVASGYYEIEIYAFFTKDTSAGTVTWTFTNSAAPTGQNIITEFSPITGIVTGSPTATMLNGQIYNDTTAAKTVVSGSLTASVVHFAHFKIMLKNGTGTSLKIQATVSAGNITPGIGSWWRCRRLSPNNVGTFAA